MRPSRHAPTEGRSLPEKRESPEVFAQKTLLALTLSFELAKRARAGHAVVTPILDLFSITHSSNWRRKFSIDSLMGDGLSNIRKRSFDFDFKSACPCREGRGVYP